MTQTQARTETRTETHRDTHAHPHSTTRPWIEYVSYADASGYGQAAAGYVRLLVQAGWAVHWVPWLSAALWGGRTQPGRVQAECALGRAAVMARSLGPGGQWLRDLLAATQTPPPAGHRVVRVLHTLPRFWPALLAQATPEQQAQGLTHVGMTVWETDRLPADWLPALRGVQRLVVPCQHNQQVVQTARAEHAGLPPVFVAPHARRQALQPPPPPRLTGLAQWLGIQPNDHVFYTINAWDPRKRLGQLIDGFARTFTADEPAVLVVKTNRRAWFDDPLAPDSQRDVPHMVQTILNRVAAETGRPPGRVALMAQDEVADSVIDGIHTLGHTFVTWSRCEGFGLGSYDAACLGKPVIAVNYGGPRDYLGDDVGDARLGLIPYRLVPCQPIAGFGWFDDQQKWPEPDDTQALALMRDALQRPQVWHAQAQARAQQLAQTFADAPLCLALEAALVAALEAAEEATQDATTEPAHAPAAPAAALLPAA